MMVVKVMQDMAIVWFQLDSLPEFLSLLYVLLLIERVLNLLNFGVHHQQGQEDLEESVWDFVVRDIEFFNPPVRIEHSAQVLETLRSDSIARHVDHPDGVAVLQHVTQLSRTKVTQIVVSDVQLFQEGEVSHLQHLVDEGNIADACLVHIECLPSVEQGVIARAHQLIVIDHFLDLLVLLYLKTDGLGCFQFGFVALLELYILDVLVFLDYLKQSFHLLIANLVPCHIDMVNLGEFPDELLQKVKLSQVESLQLQLYLVLFDFIAATYVD